MSFFLSCRIVNFSQVYLSVLSYSSFAFCFKLYQVYSFSSGYFVLFRFLWDSISIPDFFSIFWSLLLFIGKILYSFSCMNIFIVVFQSMNEQYLHFIICCLVSFINIFDFFLVNFILQENSIIPMCYYCFSNWTIFMYIF